MNYTENNMSLLAITTTVIMD